MNHIREKIRIVSATGASILISGEPGTGKTLAAKQVHLMSRRSSGPLLTIDFSAIPANLQMIALFGDETSAGAVTEANGGTLVLENVDAMAPEVQSRVCEWLGEPARAHSVRIVGTTSKDLDEESRTGRFREELRYLLGVVEIGMPVLRDRREDIPELIDTFITTLSIEHDKPPIRLSRDAVEKLCGAYWQGNVRELRAAIERAVVLRGGRTVGEDDLPIQTSSERWMNDLERIFREGSIREMERLMILSRLDAQAQNRTRTANTLDISVRTLRNKLNEYNVPRKGARALVPHH